MDSDSTTGVGTGSRLTEAEAEQLTRIREQVWAVAMQTGLQVALVAHQELTEFRQALTGEQE